MDWSPADTLISFFALIGGIIIYGLSRDQTEKSITIAEGANIIAGLSKQIAEEALFYAKNEYLLKNYPHFVILASMPKLISLKNISVTAQDVKFIETGIDFENATIFKDSFHKNNGIQIELKLSHKLPVFIKKMNDYRFSDVVGMLIFNDEVGNIFQQNISFQWSKKDGDAEWKSIISEVITVKKVVKK